MDLELSGRVYFAQDVKNYEMPAWYNGAVMTVIPTLRREGTALSALESMSCGTATVSTNVAGLADLPTVQCDPDAESLAVAMRETLKARVRIAKRQQQTVQDTFNMENWRRAWLKVINSLV